MPQHAQPKQRRNVNPREEEYDQDEDTESTRQMSYEPIFNASSLHTIRELLKEVRTLECEVCL